MAPAGNKAVPFVGQPYHKNNSKQFIHQFGAIYLKKCYEDICSQKKKCMKFLNFSEFQKHSMLLFKNFKGCLCYKAIFCHKATLMCNQ